MPKRGCKFKCDTRRNNQRGDGRTGWRPGRRLMEFGAGRRRRLCALAAGVNRIRGTSLKQTRLNQLWCLSHTHNNFTIKEERERESCSVLYQSSVYIYNMRVLLPEKRSARVFLTLIWDRFRALNSKKRCVVFDGAKTATAEGEFLQIFSPHRIKLSLLSNFKDHLKKCDSNKFLSLKWK